MLSMRMDLAYEGTLNEALEDIAKAHPKVYARVVEARGPGGGWPDIEWLALDREAMDAFVAWYANGDEQDIAWMRDELISEV